ncbi:MAG: tetratricopeptide repeat protein [Anaerolineae bacterium]|nr:tetratricopeptide repeat protein [Anaerolineae bacterium]
MEYRPREKKRNPFITLFLSVLLLVLTFVLALLLSIYIGYLDIEVPTLAQQFGPTPTPTQPAVFYIADGDTYFAQGKLNEAADAYEQAIKLEPDNDLPYIRQSRLLIYTHDTAKAVERAAQAVLLNPPSPENLAYYCRALDWEARYGEALDACSCAIELAPDYAEGYAFLSEIYADQAQWVLARTTAQQALEANFQSMDAHHNMGYALEVQGRYAEAAEFYENAAALAPNLGPLYIAAGRSHYWAGDLEKAIEHYKKAIKLSPTDPEGYDRLGWTYYTDGDYARALDALEQSAGVDPSYYKAWGHMGMLYYTRQNFEAAAEFLPKAVELAEDEFLRRARWIEIHTEIETLTGPESVPILRGRFSKPAGDHRQYLAQLSPVGYQSTLQLDSSEESCAETIVRSIQGQSILVDPTQSITLTQTYSQSTGLATLNLSSGMLSLDVSNLPQPEHIPYEVKMTFWPNRIDTVGYVQPDGNQQVKANIQFEEKLSAPIEYYYTLGLAFAYLEPPLCDRAVPWLLRALEIDSSAYNPAWAGLRICPSPNSPPTPIPTPTPLPGEEDE